MNRLEMIEKANRRSWNPLLVNTCNRFNKTGMKILEVGINGDEKPGGNAYLFNNATYETLDIIESLNPTYTEDIRALSFDSNVFDLIICTCVLEHIPEGREQAIKELLRCTRSTLIMAFPTNDDPMEEKPFSPVNLSETLNYFEGYNIPFTFQTDNGVVYFEVNKDEQSK